MTSFLFRRFAVTLPVVWGVVTLTFLLIHFVPGDPIDLILGDQATALDKQALSQELGLDLPLVQQYKNYLTDLSQLDFGRSLHSRKPVFDEIIERLPATAELTLGAMFLAILVGIPLGLLTAIYKNSFFDSSTLVVSLFGLSMPGFWLGPMLILVFAIHLDLFPVSERGGLENLVLPAVSLALGLSAVILRMTRASVLEVLNEDYILVAKAKGLPSWKIYLRYALGNALMPILTILGLQFGALLTGTVITETIFDWPGIGTLFFEAIQQRNYPVVQGCVLFISLTYVFVNLLTDISYALVNPKVRLGA